MPLTRRDMLGLGITAALVPFAHPAHAAKFVNRTGLAAGQFVWEPSQPKSGPVVILVSRLEQLVHVYRNGAVIGISTCLVGSSTRTPMGVFTLNDPAAAGRSDVQKAAAKADDLRDLRWSAMPLHAVNLQVKSPDCVRVPTPFARLLATIADAGTLLIITDRHSRANMDVRTDNLLPATLPKASAGDGSNVAIILSRADRSALLLRGGVMESRARIRISKPRAPLGTHVYAMLASDGGPARWLGVGLGRSNREPHLAAWRGSAVMERLAFEDSAAAEAMSAQLAPGATLIVTDAPAGAMWRSKAPDLVVLAAQSAALEQPQQRSAAESPATRQKRSQWAGFLPTILP